MKKILMALVVLAMPIMASAQMYTGVPEPLTLSFTDNISTADSVAAATRVDTAWSGLMNLAGLNRLQFYVDLEAGSAGDTNWTADTFFVKFQSSFDGDTWLTYELDTLLDIGTGYPALVLLSSDSVFGFYGRAMLVHWDSMEAAAEIQGNNYYKNMTLYVKGYK